MTLDEIRADLEANIPRYTFEHVLRVEETGAELARIHKETTQALFAGTMTGAEAAAEMATAAKKME